MKKYCKNCTLSAKASGVTIDNKGLCDYCAGRSSTISELNRPAGTSIDKLKVELEDTFQKIRGQSKYDCVLALSGGKDSAYLLYHLVVEKKLKVLAVHIKQPFGSKYAARNINQLKEKLSFDLKTIDPGEDFYVKFYAGLFQHPSRLGFTATVCSCCFAVIAGYCIRVATENNIPLVILGNSPMQAPHSFFELDSRCINTRKWIPDIFRSGKYNEEFLDNFWDPFRYPEKTSFPRVIYPFHIMEYNIDKIYQTLAQNKILSRNSFGWYHTNCGLLPLMFNLDEKCTGRHPFLMELAVLLRKGMVRKEKVIYDKARLRCGRIFGRIRQHIIEKKLNIKLHDIISQFPEPYFLKSDYEQVKFINSVIKPYFLKNESELSREEH